VDYHSGMIDTRGLYETKYGYFECRMKLQKEIGLWSAFWLNSPTMGQFIGDVANGGTEIDVIEYLRSGTNKTTSYHTLHWDGYGKEHKRHGERVHLVSLEDGRFHTFGVGEVGRAFASGVCRFFSWRR